MTLHLRIGAAERHQHRKGEQLPGAHVQAGAGEVVTEAIRGKIPLEVLLVVGGGGVHGVDRVVADDVLLHRHSLVVSCFRCRGRLARQRQLDAALGEHVVGGVQEVEHLRQTDVRHGLIDDLLDLHRGDPGRQSGAEHRPVLTDRLAGDDRRQLHHQPGAQVEAGVAQDFVEREVVEHLDQLGIGDRQCRYVTWKEFVVVALRGFADRHPHCSRWP